MVDLSHKQKQSLEDKTRLAIYEYLSKPHIGAVTVGTIVQEVEGVPANRAKVFYHLAELERVGLVEKVAGTRTYRVVASS
jgi:predicted transcriptional regulator